MEFMNGKFYRTRGGRKMLCLAKIPFDTLVRPWVFCTESGTVYLYQENGRWGGAEAIDDSYDIIAEWKEPVTVTVYWFSYVRHDGSKGIEIYTNKITAQGQMDILARNKGFRFSPIEEAATVVP